MTVLETLDTKPNLELAQRIMKETLFDGFFSLVVDGVQRTGKSSYIGKGLAFANGDWEFNPEPVCVKPDFSSVEPWMVFKPS